MFFQFSPPPFPNLFFSIALAITRHHGFV
jgi:hypothetical protein